MNLLAPIEHPKLVALYRKAERARAKSKRLQRTWQAWWNLRDSIGHLPLEDRWVVICAYCHRFRRTDGEWEELPPTMAGRGHVGFDFTHGVCADCLDRLPEPRL